ncbi:hypothetical protein GF312_06530 [Candidatus Poribacteria bacterium]|nr:hypothetical protein [Candidatus Poribacteria bacterium]
MVNILRKNLPILIFIILIFIPCHIHAKEWSSVESEHFVVMYSESRKKALEIQKIAEDFYPKVTENLGYSTPRKIAIWFFESRKNFHMTARAPIQDWAAGYAYPLHARIAIKDPSSLENRRINLTHLLKHEITHVIFGLYMGDNLEKVPTWFNEGIAMYGADEWSYGEYWTILMGTLSDSIIPLKEISYTFPRGESKARLAYAQSSSVINFIVERYGHPALRECIRLMASGYSFNRAMNISMGISVDWLEHTWLNSIKKRYKWISILSSWVIFWTLVILIAVIAYLRRKARNRRILKEWEEEEELWWPIDVSEGYEDKTDQWHY